MQDRDICGVSFFVFLFGGLFFGLFLCGESPIVDWHKTKLLTYSQCDEHALLGLFLSMVLNCAYTSFNRYTLLKSNI